MLTLTAPSRLVLTGAPGPPGVALSLWPAVEPLFEDECVLCDFFFECECLCDIPEPCVVVCALSPACRPVAELGGLSCANADAQTSECAGGAGESDTFHVE